MSTLLCLHPPQITTFLHKLLITLLYSCTTYPTQPPHQGQALITKIPRTWHTAPNILHVELYTLLLVVEHTKMFTVDTFIFIDNLNSICLLLNHIRNPSSQYNHPNKLLTTHIIHTIKTHLTTSSFAKYKISGNDEANKLTKKGAKEPTLMSTPYHLIRHQTPYWPSIPFPPTSTQHDNLVRNLKRCIYK